MAHDWEHDMDHLASAGYMAESYVAESYVAESYVAESDGWLIQHVAETGSTNADLVAQATRGAPDRTVLVADVQHQGRGRMGRDWMAPAGTALMASILLRPEEVRLASRGWIGAILGIAVARGIRQQTQLEPRLKWPNDVLIDGCKTAGILAELTPEALVVGVGVNVTLTEADLPRPDATSLLLAGASPAQCERAALLAAILKSFALLLDRWTRASGDVEASGIRADYLALSATVGRQVTVHLPDGERVAGTAVDVAVDGAIVIDNGGVRRRWTAGDVEHLRTPAE